MVAVVAGEDVGGARVVHLLLLLRLVVVVMLRLSVGIQVRGHRWLVVGANSG